IPGRTGNSPLGKVYGRELWTLQTLVGLLMIICCANLSSLRLSRTLTRQHELVVRSALGAGRLRLVRQLVVESMLLSASGAAAGMLLSQWMSGLLVRYVEQSDFPVFLDLRPNLTILAAVIALAALTVILTGALPALNLTRLETEEMLRSGAQRAVGRKRHPLAARLLPGQVALCLVLTSLALLFAVSTGRLLRVDPGFRVKGITFFGVDFGRRPEKGEARLDLYRKMLDGLRRAPGVEAASVVAVRPLGEGGIDESAAPVEGHGPEDKHLFENVVGPEYFTTAGTKILAGREISKFDRFGAIPVCVLNQAAANFFFPQQSPIGKERLVSVLSLFCGGLALLLTSIGLYGLESQRVERRTPEIGLRMALGAQKSDMLWFVLREATFVFLIGLPLGLLLTFAACRFVGSLLYEMSPFDPRIHLI